MSARFALATACVVAFGCGGGGSFSWAPQDHPAVVRGREAARRLGLDGAWQVVVQVDNAFSAENRRALVAAEERLRGVRGIRDVVGPSRLLEVSWDVQGKAKTRLVLERGGDEQEGEAVRQRIVRRGDALGWFFSADGREVRFLVDGDHVDGSVHRIERALRGAGLKGLRGADELTVEVAPLWPDPGRGGWLVVTFFAAWVAFVLALGTSLGVRWRCTSRSTRATAAALVAAGISGSLLFVFAGVGPLRRLAVLAGLVAAGTLALAVFVRARRRGRRRTHDDAGVGVPPHWAAAVAAAIVVAALGLGRRMEVGTRQWDAAPMFFVSVRGDLDQPVVLRELRRLTDFVRAQPGVANAWSVADMVASVSASADDQGQLPETADEVRRVLLAARPDPALRLELGPQNREGVVVVRLDERAPVDRLELIERVTLYAQAELRSAMVPVDLDNPALPPATRSLGRGILASDASERIARLCARSGRPLGETERLAVERVARQAAAVPTADADKLRAEIAADWRDFAAATPDLPPLRLSEQAKLVEGFLLVAEDTAVDEIERLLEGAYGDVGGIRPGRLRRVAEALNARLVETRFLHAAQINVREMLNSADLPTEGMLADEVRATTIEAMGPLVGIPVAATTPGALRLDAMAVGGAANDLALSDAITPALHVGWILAVAAATLFVLAVGGTTALGWLPLGLAPASGMVLAAVLLDQPLALGSLGFLGGALTAGIAAAVLMAGRRRR